MEINCFFPQAEAIRMTLSKGFFLSRWWCALVVVAFSHKSPFKLYAVFDQACSRRFDMRIGDKLEGLGAFKTHTVYALTFFSEFQESLAFSQKPREQHSWRCNQITQIRMSEFQLQIAISKIVIPALDSSCDQLCFETAHFYDVIIWTCFVFPFPFSAWRTLLPLLDCTLSSSPLCSRFS